MPCRRHWEAIRFRSVVAGMEIMRILGVVTDKNVEEGVVPGLERAIPKNKGADFASLLQQFAADFAASPFGPTPRAILLEIDPDAKDRLPKRGGRKAADVEPEPEKGKKSTEENEHARPEAGRQAGREERKSSKKKAAPPAPNRKRSRPSAKTGKSIAKKAAPGAKKSASKQLARRKPR